MQKSPNRHVLVRLRRELGGMTQAQFGKLVGLSRRTVQAIELGTLPLSERSAHRISEETDIDVYWLLENRLEEPIKTRRGQPWNLEWFQVAQAGTWRGGYRLQKEPLMLLLRAYYKLRWIAADRDFFELTKHNFPLNLHKAVDGLWETIPDRDERNRLSREYRDENLRDDEILKRVIADARELLAALRDLKKRTKNKQARRPQRQRPVRPS